MPDVFISYAHSDSSQVARLVKALKTIGVVGWQDKADMSGGEAVSSTLRNALKRANAVLVLLSPASLRSEWVQFEVGAAEALDKKIIPVLLSGDGLEENLPDILKDRIWIDARHRPYEDVARELTRAIESG